ESQLRMPGKLQWIQRQFPNVGHFEYIQKLLLVPELLTLVRGWRTQLSRLSIIIQVDELVPPTSKWSPLLKALYELPHLRELKLYEYNGLQWATKFDIPNLPKLETLFFGLPAA